MVQSFGIEVATMGDAGIDAGLGLLSRPPEWLMAIEDLDRLHADFERSIPELASGALRLRRCKFKRAHIIGGTWESLCRLTVEDPRDGSTRDIDVHGRLVLPEGHEPRERSVGAFPNDGWRSYLADVRWDFRLESSDTGLAALPLLTDPDRSRELLEDALRNGADGLDDLQIAGCEPTVKRYREGRRCAIRYELEYLPELRRPRWPDGVLAKVYEGEEARATHEAMRALWSSPLGTSSTVTIAEPLALIPDLHVSVQGLVMGDHTLKDAIKTSFGGGLRAGVEALSAPVRLAGRGLAELHASNAAGGPTITWERQVGEVRRASEHLASVVPELGGAIEPLVARLVALAEETPAGPLVPTHRSFRPAQLLLDGEAMALIDFDGFCQAEAGLDLALFRATLVDLCLRALDDGRPTSPAEQWASQAQLDELCVAFLEGYQEVGQISPARLALWDALTSAKDVLDCWRKVKFEHLERRMRFLHDKLGTVAAEVTVPRAARAPHGRA
ncbi:hypothetical protein [Aeromicrobium sp.]|uniref:hypothetical protein n=1 Tax=Aeromicrobium sp. TaxID=1871063 RepID=UPI003D6AD639